MNTDWHHGSYLKLSEAEALLKHSSVNTWLLRLSPKKGTLVISQRLDGGYKHLVDLTGLDVSPHYLVKGYSSQYPFANIFVTSKIFKDCIYDNGSLSNKQTHANLEHAPAGTWLLRYSEYHKKYMISIRKIKNKKNIIVNIDLSSIKKNAVLQN